MRVLIVVNNPQEWPLNVPGVEVVAARSYLVDPEYVDLERAKVFNFGPIRDSVCGACSCLLG